MNVDARAEAWVRLHAAGLPSRALTALLGAFGSAEAVTGASPAARRRVAGDAAAGLERLDPDRLARTLQWLGAPGHHLVAWDDPEYPRRLLTIHGPPPVLFTVGDTSLLARPALAIVGSRNGTPQGCVDAEAFARHLSDAGLVIVSGLALGIDAAAHRGGLAGHARSIAVVGTGPDRIYPARNRDLAHALADRGLLVSEFAPGTPPLPGHFPRRNRILSGLALGVLVVEATLSSGSLITARHAGEQGREVFAIPGSIHSPFSRGCHRLLREGAKLVETARDVLEELGLTAITLSEAANDSTELAVSPESDALAAALLASLGGEMLDVDDLIARTGFVASVVVASLTALELSGRVASLPDGRWQRLASEVSVPSH